MSNKQQIVNVYSKEARSAVIKYLKQNVKGLKAHSEAGWIILEGNEENNYLSYDQTVALFEIGLIDSRLIGTKQYDISPDHMVHVVKLFGL